MNAAQIFRLCAEHCPDARTQLQDELAVNVARQAEIRLQLVALEELMVPALRMTPRPGTLEEKKE